MGQKCEFPDILRGHILGLDTKDREMEDVKTNKQNKENS